MAILQRAPMAIPDTPAALLGEPALAEEAQRVLGYRPMEDPVGRQTRARAFHAMLTAAGVTPFTPESIRRYKRHMRRRASRAWWRYLPALLMPGAAIFTALTVPHPIPGLIIGALLGAIPGGALTAMLLVDAPRFVWQQRGLSVYKLPVPASVLRTAIAVQRAADAHKVPISLLVDSLVRENAPRARAYDPFLVVSEGMFPLDESGPISAHIAVWDEPTFEG